MKSPDPLGKLLRFDPLAEAERLTGTSIHDPAPDGQMNAATALGFVVMQSHAAAKEAALRARGDTLFSNELGRYLGIIEAAGFEQVLSVPFQHYPDHGDRYFIYARRDGLLLAFDTFGGEKTVNGGKVYYSWRPSEAARENPWAYTSSGGYRGDVWQGDHDCREALIYNLDRLAANGEFVCPWVERPFLWLLNYAEPKVEGYDYHAINRERIAALPPWVREFIGPADNVA